MRCDDATTSMFDKWTDVVGSIKAKAFIIRENFLLEVREFDNVFVWELETLFPCSGIKGQLFFDSFVAKILFSCRSTNSLARHCDADFILYDMDDDQYILPYEVTCRPPNSPFITDKQSIRTSILLSCFLVSYFWSPWWSYPWKHLFRRLFSWDF